VRVITVLVAVVCWWLWCVCTSGVLKVTMVMLVVLVSVGVLG
jgi:hypothetical protein